jgi:hypothetical protein
VREENKNKNKKDVKQDVSKICGKCKFHVYVSKQHISRKLMKLGQLVELCNVINYLKIHFDRMPTAFDFPECPFTAVDIDKQSRPQHYDVIHMIEYCNRG